MAVEDEAEVSPWCVRISVHGDMYRVWMSIILLGSLCAVYRKRQRDRVPIAQAYCLRQTSKAHALCAVLQSIVDESAESGRPPAISVAAVRQATGVLPLERLLCLVGMEGEVLREGRRHFETLVDCLVVQTGNVQKNGNQSERRETGAPPALPKI